jgi:hypothetical protein
MMLGAVVVLSGFVLAQGPALYDEVKGLQRERDRSRLSGPIGFIDISPHPSYAVPPRDWIRREGDTLLLWSGWDRGTGGHAWFRIGKDDLDTGQLHIPMGRDVIRAIDHTRVESRGGTIWARMQPEMKVIALHAESPAGATDYAYPLLLLEKVQAINETLDGRPVLMLHTPFVPDAEALDLFDPVVAGERVRLASSGHYINPGRRPVLYDRDRQDLWARGDAGMVCLAGARKGAVLKRLSRPATVSWGDWADEHPDGRLVVGADRTAAAAAVPSMRALARAGGAAAGADAP